MLKRTGEWAEQYLSSNFEEKIDERTVAVAGRQMKCGVYSCAAYEEFSAGLSDDLSKKPGDCSYCRLLGHYIIVNLYLLMQVGEIVLASLLPSPPHWPPLLLLKFT